MEKKRRVDIDFECPCAENIREAIQMKKDEVATIHEAKLVYDWAILAAKLPICLKEFQRQLTLIDEYHPVVVDGRLDTSVDRVMMKMTRAITQDSTGYFATDDQWHDVILPELRKKGFIVTKLDLFFKDDSDDDEEDEDEEEGEVKEDKQGKNGKHYKKRAKEDEDEDEEEDDIEILRKKYADEKDERDDKLNRDLGVYPNTIYRYRISLYPKKKSKVTKVANSA